MLGNGTSKMDDMEFGRRLAVERDLEKNGIDKGQAATCNAGTIYVVLTDL
jgi:peptidylprolyl isomerase domain and WD repeat-containing protein 1